MPVQTGPARPGAGLPGDILPASPRLLSPEIELTRNPDPVWDTPRTQYLWPANALVNAAPFAESPLTKWRPRYDDFARGLPLRDYGYPTNAQVKATPFAESPLTKWTPSYDNIVWDSKRTQFLWPSAGFADPLSIPGGPGAVSTARPQRGLPGRILPDAPRLLSPDVPSLVRTRELPVWDIVRRQDLYPNSWLQLTGFTPTNQTVDRWWPRVSEPLFDVGHTSHLAQVLALVKAASFAETVLFRQSSFDPPLFAAPPLPADVSAHYFDSLPLPKLVISAPFVVDGENAVTILHSAYAAASHALTQIAGSISTTDAFPDVGSPGSTLPDWSLQGVTVDLAAVATNVGICQPLFDALRLQYLAPYGFQRLFDVVTETTLVSKWFAAASEPVRDVVRQQALYPALAPISTTALGTREPTLVSKWFRETDQPMHWYRVPRSDWTYQFLGFWPKPIIAVNAGGQYFMLLGIGS